MRQFDVNTKIIGLVKTKECGEELVDLGAYPSKIKITIHALSRDAQKIKPGACFVRLTVANKLLRAQSFLPKGLRLKIIDTYRPIGAQMKLWKKRFREIKRRNPKMSDAEVERETDKWVGNPNKIIPPHSTGGAVDLTIIDSSGKELDMGTRVGSIDKRSITKAKIPVKYRRNRKILIKAMSKVGFANYKGEWWHWSYGEWGWAYAYKKDAIYKSVTDHK